MLFTQKTDQDFNFMAEKVVQYAERSGYEEIKADFTGYESPASLTMINNDIRFTPDFSAKRGSKKYFFELAVKNDDKKLLLLLITKWKALEAMAKIKGGFLQLFAPNGSFRFAANLLKEHHIDAKLIKLADLK